MATPVRVDGDHEIMPGLKLVATHGHTPGHQSALVTLPAEPDAPLRAVAQMVVETVDPCIATSLEVRDA